MMGKSAIALFSRRLVGAPASRAIPNGVAGAQYTTTNPLSAMSKYYRVEVSNASRPDATKITVRGPDVDGILASMTVALAKKGCSLKELHAGYREMNDTISFEKHVEGDQIEDIFFVAKHETGQQFPDDSLYDLGEALLESLNNPMTCLSGKADEESPSLPKDLEASNEEQIIVVKKDTK